MNYRKMLAEGLATHQEVKTFLKDKSIWQVGDMAAYLNVTTSFYRRNLLGLAGHPTPIDPSAGKLQWWSCELIPWLDNPENLKKSKGRAAA